LLPISNIHFSHVGLGRNIDHDLRRCIVSRIVILRLIHTWVYVDNDVHWGRRVHVLWDVDVDDCLMNWGCTLGVGCCVARIGWWWIDRLCSGFELRGALRCGGWNTRSA